MTMTQAGGGVSHEAHNLSQAGATPAPATTLISATEVCRRLGVTKKTLWTYRREPALAFPDAVELPRGLLRFRESEVDAWISQRTTRSIRRSDPPI